MEIKDIVEQEKHKRTLAKIKKREDALTRKQFLKDCYKFWKEYKKVESPYFWWLEKDWLVVKTHYLWCLRHELPKEYYANCDLHKKWDIDWCSKHFEYKIKRKTNPNDTWIYLD